MKIIRFARGTDSSGPAPGTNARGAGLAAVGYYGASTSTGSLQDGDTVRYHRTMKRSQTVMLTALIALNTIAGVGLLAWLGLASRISSGGLAVGIALLVLMILLECVRLFQSATIMVYAAKARDPVPLKPGRTHRVAILTTIVPGKEPLAMAVRTLRAMQAIEYPGTADVWLLDEGDDPEVRSACSAIGVRHFSRKGIAAWNQPSGPFKARSKAGNHNSWRDLYQADYDIVAQMDPDHIPGPDFLERTIGYFNDPDTGFVVAPMVYGNIDESWIAHGAAQQAYVFQGITQRGANGMDAPLLIGTNHLYRATCWNQIGGYQDSIIEDHLTAMAVYTARNPDTGNRWRGVYTPDVLAVGEGPTSFTDFFNQQKRWAWGCWEVITKHSRGMLPQMKLSQRVSYLLLQPYYPSIAVGWLLSLTLTSLYMFSRVSLNLPIIWWGLLWGSSVLSGMSTAIWLRRFNLTGHERREWGVLGMILTLMTIPVYFAAAASKVTGRKLVYAVTAKGDCASPDNVRTFSQHLIYAAWSAMILAASLTGRASSWPLLRFWALSVGMICISPVAVHYGSACFRTVRDQAILRQTRQAMAEEHPVLTGPGYQKAHS
jgi:cellulose synthase/poly-beta-1,6-N-acetylglucosamine synthase-like glycosyltransferase